MPQKFQKLIQQKKIGIDLNNNINLSKADIKMSGIDPEIDAINQNLNTNSDNNFNVNVTKFEQKIEFKLEC